MTRGPGVFVAVVGPSGAGKDTLLSAARAELRSDPRFSFARRVITRRPDHSEDHDSVDGVTFDALRNADGFALWWEAHGLKYALRNDVLAALAQGTIVVANISRASLPEVRARFSRSFVIEVTATEETLQRRLAARGREAETDRQARIARARSPEAQVAADLTIFNDGPLSEACRAFTAALRARIDTLAPAPAAVLPAAIGL